MMALKWYGKQVSEKMRKAQIAGVNATMGACITDAKRNHRWNNRTGVLEGSIGIAEPAAVQGGKGGVMSGVRGVWGSKDVRYALIHELGGVIKPVRAKALMFRADDGTFVVAKQVTIPERPYLRPAADKHYPKLAKRIRRAFEASSGGR
ncbi:MAG: phage morphogenesis protein [Rhizobiaceae bacterium]|nr:phage morphogenesis protein [Rhizobiaceae bacterium]